MELYRAKQDIQSSEAWTADYWEVVVVGEELARLDGALQECFHDAAANAFMWESGGISSSNGTNSSNGTRIRTKTYLGSNILAVSVASGYKYIVAAYSSGTYQGMWNGSSLQKSATWRTVKTNLKDIGDYQFRLVFATSSDASIAESDGTNCVFTMLTDAALAMPGVPADAKTTGDGLTVLQSAIGGSKISLDSLQFQLGVYINYSGQNATSKTFGLSQYVCVTDGGSIVFKIPN